MHADRVRLLITALRSGIFVQTNGTLERAVSDGSQIRRENCCLGVGCRVAQFNGYDLTPDVVTVKTTVVNLDGENSFLPRGVADWYDFSTQNPYLEILGATASVANDNGYTFEDIAYALESELSKQETGSPLPLPEDRDCRRCANFASTVRMTLPGRKLCDTCYQTTRIEPDPDDATDTDPDKYLD